MEQDGAQSLYRAISIIRTVAKYEENGVRMSKIASSVGLPTTTVHRILSVLAKEGFIELDPTSKHYHLGIELFTLGLKAHKFLIREKYRDALERIANKTGETAYLITRSGNDAVCIDRVLGTFPIQVLTFEIGQRRPLGIGGGSVAILSNLPQDEIEAIVNANSTRYQSYRGRSADDVMAIVKQAQIDGYGMSEKNVTEDTIGVGVPIFDQTGLISGAVSVAGIERRMGQEQIKIIVKLIKSEVGVFKINQSGQRKRQASAVQ